MSLELPSCRSLFLSLHVYPQVLGFNLTESGLFAVLPWLTMAVASNGAGWIADTLICRGWDVTTVRKVSLGPSLMLVWRLASFSRSKPEEKAWRACARDLIASFCFSPAEKRPQDIQKGSVVLLCLSLLCAVFFR